MSRRVTVRVRVVAGPVTSYSQLQSWSANRPSIIAATLGSTSCAGVGASGDAASGTSETATVVRWWAEVAASSTSSCGGGPRPAAASSALPADAVRPLATALTASATDRSP